MTGTPTGAREGAGTPGAADVLRIGNCSGFYGDRMAAAREMIDGGLVRHGSFSIEAASSMLLAPSLVHRACALEAVEKAADNRVKRARVVAV